jgi:hypothetical protein
MKEISGILVKVPAGGLQHNSILNWHGAEMFLIIMLKY